MIRGTWLWGLVVVATHVGRAADGAANGSAGWSSSPRKNLPAGWSTAQLDSGEDFYFRVEEPEKIFWEFPSPAEDVLVPTSPQSQNPAGAAKLRHGEVLGEIELCDSGHLGGIRHDYEGLINFMRRYGFHFINKHPQKHTQELNYSKGACKKGHLEPHIKFVEKADRSAVVEYMSVAGKSATQIVSELQARGIDPTVRHPDQPQKRQARNKWGVGGALLPKNEL
jgi:hypothetical protein